MKTFTLHLERSGFLKITTIILIEQNHKKKKNDEV